MSTTSIVMVGVGGQGTILASRLLGDVAVNEGFDVKISEVHGMSQRGGSVITYLRYGDKVYSPITGFGGADYLIAFEQLEAARWLPMLKRGGKLIVSEHRVNPAPVLSGEKKYPDDIERFLEQNGIDTIKIDALKEAKDAGIIKAANVVMMGAFAHFSEFDVKSYEKSLENIIPKRFFEGNRRAFMRGYDSVREKRGR